MRTPRRVSPADGDTAWPGCRDGDSDRLTCGCSTARPPVRGAAGPSTSRPRGSRSRGTRHGRGPSGTDDATLTGPAWWVTAAGRCPLPAGPPAGRPAPPPAGRPAWAGRPRWPRPRSSAGVGGPPMVRPTRRVQAQSHHRRPGGHPYRGDRRPTVVFPRPPTPCGPGAGCRRPAYPRGWSDGWCDRPSGGGPVTPPDRPAAPTGMVSARGYHS